MQIVPYQGAEKESLKAALDRHREAVLWKVDGVSDADLRRSVVPSGTTLLGLVKHLAWTEYGWFVETFGRPTELPPAPDDDPDLDWRIEDGESTAEILALYARARAASDEVIAELDVQDTGTAWHGATVSLRWVLIHMVEELARHAGHADIMRELIDGFTGDHVGSHNTPEPDGGG